jgi:hypothetical protein
MTTFKIVFTFEVFFKPWNFKTSHFRIIYSFPSRISALFLLHTKTDDAILLTNKSCQIIESIKKYGSVGRFTVFDTYVFKSKL